jgi:hypothetical protein
MRFDDENYADTFYKGVKYLPLQTSLKEKKEKKDVKSGKQMADSTF